MTVVLSRPNPHLVSYIFANINLMVTGFIPELVDAQMQHC